jgi:hypothetical protein
VTVQVPLPEVIVYVAPVFEHEPLLVYVIAPVPSPDAATVKLAPYSALDGADVVNVTVLLANEALKESENSEGAE